jgi:hypothetical protein
MLSTAQKEFWNHQATITEDGSDHDLFRWHFPPFTFDARMSAFEIAQFIIPHMSDILPMLGGHPHIQAEFKALQNRLTQWPEEVLDEVHGWIRTLTRATRIEEDDIIELCVGGRLVTPVGPTHFVLAGG